jgi:succinylglutamic semialdehyde dehydrogenase
MEVNRFVKESGSNKAQSDSATVRQGDRKADSPVALPAGADVEVFGPFLRLSIVKDLDDAIAQANATDFGLAASLFTKDPAAIARFQQEVRAGCVNINTGTAGASSKLPFGGLGHSGNHRPAGAFSLDYCAYPVAGMIEEGGTAVSVPGMRFEESWLGN